MPYKTPLDVRNETGFIDQGKVVQNVANGNCRIYKTHVAFAAGRPSSETDFKTDNFRFSIA